jgi:hypothetical protein
LKLIPFLALLAAPFAHASDRPFQCVSDYGSFHFEALGTLDGDRLTGEVTGNVYKDGRLFQSAHSTPAASAFGEREKLEFTAKSLLVQVTVQTKFENGAYSGVMNVHSFLGGTPPMNTTCSVQ